MYITDEQVEKALDWLRDEAPAIGAAKERLVKAEHMVKHIKAIEMKRCIYPQVGQQEREAIASEAYHAAIMEEAVAAGEYEKMKAIREAAALKIGVWQTMSANFRAMKL